MFTKIPMIPDIRAVFKSVYRRRKRPVDESSRDADVTGSYTVIEGKRDARVSTSEGIGSPMWKIEYEDI